MADALMNSDHLLTRAPMRVITHACESPFSLDRSRSGSGRRDSPGAGAGQDRLHRQATRDSMAATRIASRGCTSTARSPSAWCSITPAALVSACVPITSGWSSAAPTSPNTPPADRVSARRNDESAPGSRNGRGRPANACAAAVGAVWPRPCQDEPSAPPTLPRSAQPNASALPPPACPDRLASAPDAGRLHAGGWPWRAAVRLAGRAADVAPTCGHAGPACVLCGACRACHARAAAAPNGGPMGLGRVHRPVLSSAPPRHGAGRAAPRLTKTERAALAQRLWDGICASPYVFLGLAKTLDEHAPEGEPAGRPFPLCAVCAREGAANGRIARGGGLSICAAHGRRHKPYFRVLGEAWRRAPWESEGIVLLEKSRQMICSWFFVELLGWQVMVRPGTRNAIQSLNYDKACELGERVAPSDPGLPAEAQRYGPLSDSPKARARAIRGKVEFPEIHAELVALPNGPNQTRMYTFTSLLMDECQHWEPDEDFEDSYAAGLATIKGDVNRTGRLVALSTGHPAGGFHHPLARGRAGGRGVLEARGGPGGPRDLGAARAPGAPAGARSAAGADAGRDAAAAGRAVITTDQPAGPAKKE